jgi:hypothetical protein
MNRLKPTRGVIIALIIAGIAGILVATSPLVAAGRGKGRDGLDRVRAATDRYHTLSAAEADGYALLKDAAGIACIDQPGTGTMGVHYVNGTLVESGVIDAEHPQLVVYEPRADGSLRLVAVEYVAFQAEWDAAHDAPPSLFGQEFMLTPAGNRYGLPAFYALHAWVWQVNPGGMFAMYNPNVSCSAASAVK